MSNSVISLINCSLEDVYKVIKSTNSQSVRVVVYALPSRTIISMDDTNACKFLACWGTFRSDYNRSDREFTIEVTKIDVPATFINSFAVSGSEEDICIDTIDSLDNCLEGIGEGESVYNFDWDGVSAKSICNVDKVYYN